VRVRRQTVPARNTGNFGSERFFGEFGIPRRMVVPAAGQIRFGKEIVPVSEGGEDSPFD